jgi:precorrin-3B synthase
MAALVARTGTAALAGEAGLTPLEEPHKPPPQRPVLGVHDLGAVKALGVGVPFGRLDSAGLSLLADKADAASGELRLTPWRALLIVGRDLPSAPAGFLLDENAPVRAIAACPGAPACSSATTATHADALTLSASIKAVGGIVLHVSGCAKGCAHAGPAPVTLVGRDGLYDLVLDGRADGIAVARGLSVADISLFLETRKR